MLNFKAPKFLKACRNYVQNAFDRRFRRERLVETNTTPFRIIFQDGLMSVRSYRAVAEAGPNAHLLGARLPVLFVPPLGVPAWVFDLMASRSLVRYFAHMGWDVYLIDWGSPGVVDAHLALNHYVVDWMPKAINVVAEYAGDCSGESASPSPVSLVGYCMGGLLALMCLGLHAPRTQDGVFDAADTDLSERIATSQGLVRNIITIASPIDFHDTTGILGKAVTLASKPLAILERRLPQLRTHIPTLVPERYFHVPGRMVAHAFAMTQPLGRLTSYLNLVWNLADRSHVVQYTALSSWFDDMLDYPGGVVRNLLLEIGPDNQLIRGRIALGDWRVDLGRVKANLLAIVGESDTLVSPSAASSIMEIVQSTDKTLSSAPGGHAAVFAGRSAPEHTWQPVQHWLSQRSDR